MKGGVFGISLPSPPPLGSALDAAKAAAKDKVQRAATDALSSDAAKAALSKAQGAANSVGLGDKFAAAKDATIGKLEALTGLDLSGPKGCPPDRIDVPTVNDILIATADTPHSPTSSMDKYFSYVVVDHTNPPPTETANKTTLWYVSIANAVLLITFGTLYGTLS
jgi:hypothetical protein